MGNKVKYNLKNVHYAPLTTAEDGTVSFGAPVRILGAVSLSMDPEGDTTPFYADGIKYYVAIANSGYTGDLEIALVPDAFRKDILGEVEDTASKVLVEYADVEPSPFALLFEFDGDKKAIRHVLYNCTAARPGIEGSTNTNNKEVKTERLSLTAAAMATGLVKAKTGDDTTEAVYKNWYKSVWQPAAEPTPAE